MYSACKRQAGWALLLALVLAGWPPGARSDVKVAPGALELESAHHEEGVPGDVIDVRVDDEASSEETGANREFVIAPLPSHSPLLGWKLAVPAMFLYKPSFTEPDDQVWITGAVGFYSESESFGGGLFHSGSLGGDLWRLRGAIFGAELNYDYYGIGNNLEQSVPLKQDMGMLLAEALHQVIPDMHAGLRVIVNRTSATLNLPEDFLPPGTPTPDIGIDFNLVTLAPRAQYDTRDNQFYPTEGWLVEGQVGISRDWVGSDRDYEDYSFDANAYFSFGAKSVLAARIATAYVAGDVPFFMFPAFGQQSDLRGYQTGTYRNRFLLATQAEWRYRFMPRFGAVAFAGVGTVDSEFGHWGETLPSAGVGVRWVIAPNNNMSLRFDIARGKDDTQFYLGMGEAF